MCDYLSDYSLPPWQFLAVRPVSCFSLWQASQLCGKNLHKCQYYKRIPTEPKEGRTHLALRSSTSLSWAFDDFLAIFNEMVSGASGSDSELCGIFTLGYNKGKGTSCGAPERKTVGGGCKLSLLLSVLCGTRHGQIKDLVRSNGKGIHSINRTVQITWLRPKRKSALLRAFRVW